MSGHESSLEKRRRRFDGEQARAAMLRRILRDAGVPDLVDRLVDLPGTDFTTLLLEVMRRRVEAVGPAELLRAYERSRFVGPAAVSWTALRDAEAAALDAVPSAFERVQLSPVVPLGCNAAVAPVHQNRVVSALRGVEVIADPANALALEAAHRRSVLLRADPRSPAEVRLATSQRVVRAQHFESPGLYAHFQLLGLVTAGRDTGNRAFEQQAAVEHLRVAVDACRATGAQAVRLDLTDLGGLEVVGARVREFFAAAADVTVQDRPDRPDGRGYYAGFCCKVYATYDGATLEVGDGGLVDWTQQLLASGKERLFILGLGLERMAAPRAARDAEDS